MIAACIAVSAWLLVVLRHRQEKQALMLGVLSHLKASDITTESPDSSQPDQISTAIYEAANASDLFITDQSPPREVKEVAKDVLTWCMVRWGGPFGARAGSNSMGGKLGIWTDRFENVRCAVMLLSMRKLNAAVVLSHQKARIGYSGPGVLHRHAACNACAGVGWTQGGFLLIHLTIRSCE